MKDAAEKDGDPGDLETINACLAVSSSADAALRSCALKLKLLSNLAAYCIKVGRNCSHVDA